MESDVLIIGGGIAGVSTAYALAQHGRSVVLLERGEVASEASGVNAGHIGALGWGQVPDLEAHLTMGSLELFKGIQIDLGYDIEYRQCGGLEAIQTEDQYAYAQDRVLRLRSQGYSLELLTAREAVGIEPEVNQSLPGFVYSPLRAKATPVLATLAFAAAATGRGARILTEHPVTAIRHDGSVYRVDTPGGEFSAHTLVMAAGAWSAPLGKMLGLSIPIVPVRGQMWATGPMPPRMFHAISSTESGYYWNTHPTAQGQTPPHLTHLGDTRLTRHLYGSQTHKREVAFGGDRQAVGYQTTRDYSGIEVNRGHTAEVIPMLAKVPIKRTWSGLMPFSLDGAPIIGKIPQRDNLYIVSGLASSGFGRGPMAGKLLADYINAGDRPAALWEADPARCVTEVG